MPYDPTSTGSVSAKDVAGYLQGSAGNPTDLAIGGLPGATAGYRLVGATTTGIPTGGTFAVGDVVLGQTEGQYYACTVAGTPGTFKNVARDTLMDALSLKTWNYNPLAVSAQSVPTSQSLYCVAVPTVAGQTYTGVQLITGTAGTSTVPTGFFVGLATNGVIGATGTMLAQSSNLNASTSLTTTGAQSFPFNATYTETATGLRMVLFFKNGTFAGTDVQFYRTSAGATFGTATTSQALVSVAGTGVTALAANGAALAATYSNSGTPWWVALY